MREQQVTTERDMLGVRVKPGDKVLHLQTSKSAGISKAMRIVTEVTKARFYYTGKYGFKEWGKLENCLVVLPGAQLNA